VRSPFVFVYGLFLGFAGMVAAQTDNTVYVKQFPGSTVGARLSAAMAACSANRSIPCILVLDPSLSQLPAGTLPSVCPQCTLADYRYGNPWAGPSSVLTIGSLNGAINPAACGKPGAPSWCSGSTLDAWIMAAIKGPCGSGPDLKVFPQCTIRVAAGSYPWAGTVTIPSATGTEQATFALVFDRGAVGVLPNSFSGDAVLITGSVYEGEHILLEDLHLIGGGAATTSAIHVHDLYSAYIVRPVISGFESGAGLWMDGGGADVENASIASAKYCVMFTSDGGQQANATHVRGGEFDGCSYGWYHAEPVPGPVHIAQANSIEHVVFEGVKTPLTDTASQEFVILGNFLEAYTGIPINLGSAENATYGVMIGGNMLASNSAAATISLVNVHNSVIFPNYDAGTPKAYISQSGGSSGNAIIGNDETATITAGGALGSGGTALCDTADGYQCTSHAGVVTVTAGTSPRAGDLFQVRWATGFSTNPVCQTQSVSKAVAVAPDITYRANNAVRIFTDSALSGSAKVAYTCTN
jgi:hypothetical protein